MTMTRYQKAADYHHKGFNCCQSILAAFTDRTGLSEQASFDAAAGFGAGMQTGEACGAIAGAVMTLGLLHPVDPENPVASKRRTGALAKEFQKRFQEKFGALRCAPLLKTKIQTGDHTPAAQEMELTNRCDILIITAVEIVEEMLQEGT
ncbi:MAG: C-GCAxxG-C-C family protein [Evtepia sp.]|uniref:C-GCAxxG-C-C family protein n=1 Tax=Evtepia sp. TaxID=2773933 RepID=UPI002A75B14B|nr:C-GCAxxG-C-C family protein [Evtepia sp.]MDY3015349.1 C-GCAxxG-C-C family protein [Evtepia sp.]